jgi:HEAT repeat protein
MNDKRLSEFVKEYLPRLASSEDALFALSEVGPEVIPHLVQAFRKESNPELRRTILEAITSYRHPSSIAVLSEALTDRSPRVWEFALDGLVSLGSPQAKETVEVARKTRLGDSKEDVRFRRWASEAIDQIQNGVFGERVERKRNGA